MSLRKRFRADIEYISYGKLLEIIDEDHKTKEEEMVNKTISLSNLYKLDWKTLVKSKTFWISIAVAVYGIYEGRVEIVVGAAGMITVRDAIAKN